MATVNAVKERPILFSGPMVRAILDGRKTQTRRVVKRLPKLPEPFSDEPWTKIGWCGWERKFLWQTASGHCKCHTGGIRCPYGQPGDRLWVRESVSISAPYTDVLPNTRGVCYLADGIKFEGVKVTPSIHMPRWASRITLEIKTVRVERLQDISESDAKAEGAKESIVLPGDRGSFIPDFANRWCEINGVESWESNPWVWVIEFERTYILSDGEFSDLLR